MPASRLDDSTGCDEGETEHETGVAGADRDRARPDGRSVGGHGRAVEHLVDEVEPGATDGERERRHDRLGAGQQAEPGQPGRQQQRPADRDDRAGRTLEPAPDGHPERQRADEQRRPAIGL